MAEVPDDLLFEILIYPAHPRPALCRNELEHVQNVRGINHHDRTRPIGNVGAAGGRVHPIAAPSAVRLPVCGLWRVMIQDAGHLVTGQKRIEPIAQERHCDLTVEGWAHGLVVVGPEFKIGLLPVARMQGELLFGRDLFGKKNAVFAPKLSVSRTPHGEGRGEIGLFCAIDHPREGNFWGPEYSSEAPGWRRFQTLEISLEVGLQWGFGWRVKYLEVRDLEKWLLR
ncbi:MAG: hypothetical protein JWL90_3176 [Chthoniobacteraceae bacterium]|nr:hypothetical protein [Chthoniobacteraceae bacterium]